MTEDLRKRYDIPAYVKTRISFPDGSEHISTLDWEEISADDYYGSMVHDKAIYKSATAGVEQSVELYEGFLKEGKDILTVSLSSGLSANYSVAVKASDILRRKYPERKIYNLDTLRYSGCIAAMLIKADELKKEGRTIDEVYRWLEDNKNRFHQMGTLDDLFFLCRTGRINNFHAFFGTLVGVNSLGDFNSNGLTDVIGKVKGKPKAIKTAVEYIKRTVEEADKQTVVVAHSLRAEAAEELKKRVAEEIKPREIIMTRVDMSCGANIGPGIAVVFYYGKEISEGLTEEKKLIEEITK